MDEDTKVQTRSGIAPIRACHPASVALLAAATNAAQIVADFRAKHGADGCDMPALRAAQRRPATPWTEERAITCDLELNRQKRTGEYDARRSGVRA